MERNESEQNQASEEKKQDPCVAGNTHALISRLPKQRRSQRNISFPAPRGQSLKAVFGPHGTGLQAHVVLVTKHQVSGHCQNLKAAIYFFFGKSAHEASRPQKSILCPPPRLQPCWSRRQQAFLLAGPAMPILAWIWAGLFLKKLKCDFETESKGSLDIWALASQRLPSWRTTRRT